MDNLLPNIDAKTYTGTAIVIGYILTEILNTNEQVALASWLTLIVDILQKNAAWVVLMRAQEARIKEAIAKEQGDLQGELEAEKELEEDEVEEVEADGGVDTIAIYEALAQLQADLADIKQRV